jgi:hypothetical protein
MHGQAAEIQKTENSFQDDYTAWECAMSMHDLVAVGDITSDAALR